MTDVPHARIADPHTHYGSGARETRNFRLQRLTAMANVFFAIFLVWLVASIGGADHATTIATLQQVWVWVPLLLLVINVPVHMRIGIREVIEDYVHDYNRRHLLLRLNTGTAIAVAALGVLAILKIAVFG